MALGLDTKNGSSNVNEVVNMASSIKNVLTNLPPYPERLDDATGQLLDSTPVIAGGTSGSNDPQSPIYKFDQEYDSWKLLGNMKTPRSSRY